jgi:hypothetical protein
VVLVSIGATIKNSHLVARPVPIGARETIGNCANITVRGGDGRNRNRTLLPLGPEAAERFAGAFPLALLEMA